MRRSILLFALSSCVATLCGCASKSSIPTLPDKLVEQGLVVARLYMPGSASWDNAKVDIDGKLHSSGLRDGFIAIALSPGEHYLSQLRIEGRLLSLDDSGGSGMRKVRGGGAPTYYYVPGGSGVRTYYTTLAVMRRFQVEAGKITNLGLMVYLADNKNSSETSKQYHAVALDNSAEIGYYLETNYPALIATMPDHAPKLAPGTYLDPKKLPELRRYIAALEAKSKKIVTAGNTSVLYGDAGTLVAARPKDGSGGGSTLEVLDTGTLANIVDARRDDDRLVFLTSEAKLLTYEGGKLSRTSVPYRIHPVKMSSIGKNNLTIVDNRLSILSSQDGGAHWTKYDGAHIDTPRSDIGVVSDAHGAYIYLGDHGLPNPILYLEAGKTTPEVVAPPPHPAPPIQDKTFNLVILRESGLFIVYPRSEFHFRSNATRTWQIYSKPAVDCKGIGFDTAGVDLTVDCGGVKYESVDSGRTWTKAGGA